MMYDKQGSVLRVETVINNPRDMKVYRSKEGDEGGPQSWQRLRKGVADIERRAAISQAANERYVEALAAADAQLLEAVNRGEFAINGFRNRDLRSLLFATPSRDASEARRRSAAISRKSRLLRALGLIHKIPKTHRYQVSPHGRDVINALLAARRASTTSLAA